jgi:hypothetical protein
MRNKYQGANIFQTQPSASCVHLIEKDNVCSRPLTRFVQRIERITKRIEKDLEKVNEFSTPREVGFQQMLNIQSLFRAFHIWLDASVGLQFIQGLYSVHRYSMYILHMHRMHCGFLGAAGSGD